MAAFAVFTAVPVTALALAGPSTADVVLTSVPAASATTTVINVTVRGDNDLATPDSPLPLEGVELRLYSDNLGTIGAVVPDAWATCTSDEDGDCSFTVPDTAGANNARRFWVKRESSPAGWFGIDSLRAGQQGVTPTIFTTPYEFRTPAMVAGSTFTSGTDFMTISPAGDQNTDSSGWWQQSRENPDLPTDLCGLRIALVLDLSGSINDIELGQLREAGVGFVDALEGTPSSVAVYTFGNGGPAVGPNNSTLDLTSVATSDGADQVRAKINGIGSPEFEFTNWDRGLLQVAQSSDDYDAVLFVTDGNPTAYGDDGIRSPGARTRFNEVERGIFSANAVKAEGTKIFGVGILGGDEAIVGPDASLNLQAVTGTTRNSDYFIVEEFADLGNQLEQIALEACESTISVVKRVIPPNGTIADAAPAAGWTFSAASTVPAAPATATTPESGAVSFAIDLTTAVSAPVTITETQQAGYTLVQQGLGPNARNAVCTRLDDGAPVTVTNQGATGFVVNAVRGPGITCEVINQAPASPAIELVKAADVASVDEVGDVINYTFTATNTGDVTLTDVEITDPLPGLSELACTPKAPATLAPAASMVCTASYSVTRADLEAGEIANVGTAVGTPPTGPPVTDEDDVTVPAVLRPAINLLKSANVTSVDAVGDVIIYTFTATNTGSIDLSDVRIDDPLPGLSELSCEPDAPAALEPDEAMVCTATYTVTQADLDRGEIANVGTATGTPPTGPDVTDDDDETVPAATESGINIVKTASSTDVAAGTKVTFTYSVTNTGGAALSGVTVVDDKCSPVTYVSGDSDSDQLLDVNEKWLFTCTATISATTTNVGTATGTTPGGGSVTDTDDATVTVAARGEVPATGGPAWSAQAALSGFALMVFGAMLLLARRRMTGM